MNTSTEKIKTELIEELKGIFGDPIPKDKITAVKSYIDNRMKTKSKNLYESYHSMHSVMCQLFNHLADQGSDSKIEVIFHQMLVDYDIPFKPQYKISPYRVDFLISDFLAFEIDGPMHKLNQEYDKQRNKYIERMGYEVMRVPVSILTMAPEIIIEEIKERIERKSKT